jgi:eukaryotic-like serine/threonine-protein kinase
MALAAGTKLGPFEILSPLGAGGMGEVWRARDTTLNRDVALKVLPEILARDPERMARFKREAQVLASLNHPNIATIYGFEESDGVRALAMELVEGQTLAELLEKTKGENRNSKIGHQEAKLEIGKSGAEGAASFEFRISSFEPLPIAKQIAEGLEYAHERGIIHRDLKPANIKITPEGAVKILDFGLAKALDPTVTAASSSSPSAAGTTPQQDSPTLTVAATQAGMILGTAAYMSPEQARGKTVDRRADIWSFGCVLYEMLTGKRLFEGETVSDTLAAVLKTEPDWDALPVDTPPRLRELVRRCLVKDPKQRLRDIGDARIAIEETLSGSPSPPAPLPQGEGGPQGRVRVSPLQCALFAAGFVALGAVLTAALFVAGVFRKPVPKPQEIRFTILSPGGYTIAGDPSRPETAVSPNGRRIAFVAADSKSNTSLWVRALDATEAQRLEGTDGASMKGAAESSENL